MFRTSSKRPISVDLFFLNFSRMENSFSRIILKFILENSREINSREASLARTHVILIQIRRIRYKSCTSRFSERFISSKNQLPETHYKSLYLQAMQARQTSHDIRVNMFFSLLLLLINIFSLSNILKLFLRSQICYVQYKLLYNML